MKPDLGQYLSVIGLQWGDEGKGKVVDFLSKDYEIVVRFQGGGNAGHTIVIDGKKYVTHSVPAGVLRNGKVSVLGPNTVPSIIDLPEEIYELKKQGFDVNPSNFKISDRAVFITPYHRLMDVAFDLIKGIGTTGRGIGPAYAQDVERSALRFGNLFDDDLEERLRENASRADEYTKIFTNERNISNYIERINSLGLGRYILDNGYMNINNLVEDILRNAEIIKPFVEDTEIFLYESSKEGKRILFEGAQGVMLDQKFGTYPDVTSSRTMGIFGNVAGIDFRDVKIIGVAKAYTTRVGNGVFPTEIFGEIADKLREKGNEYGATTGRPRRVGWIDLLQLHYSANIIGNVDEIALTKLDVLSGFNEIYAATSYLKDNKEVNHLPSNLDESYVPVYNKMRGWRKKLPLKFDDFPDGAKDYILTVERRLGKPIRYIGTGQGRRDIVAR